jgi:hypothetical protein
MNSRSALASADWLVEGSVRLPVTKKIDPRPLGKGLNLSWSFNATTHGIRARVFGIVDSVRVNNGPLHRTDWSMPSTDRDG